MKWILFFVSIAFTVPIYSSDLITSLQKQCASQSEEELPKDTYLRFIQQMEFQKAKSYCDTLERDPKNCKASSRFWLASVLYAERRFEEAIELFQEGVQLTKSFGKPREWIKYSDHKTGWGNPEDMLKYAIQSRELTLKSDGYVQNVTYLIISRTNTLDSKETKKKIDRFFNPCLALHGYLSLQVLSRHIELFSNGALRLQLNPIWLDKTATRLNDKNYIMMSSLSPWTEDLSLLMHEITKESDLVVIAFPREGGNANANYGKLPIVPGLVQSPTRTFIKLPSDWMRMLNFPQIFHEYMHTVEFLMKRKGEKEFHATSHGADGKKVQALTGLPTETTGETDWAEVLFKRQIQAKVDDIATKNAKNGWQSLFGIRSELPNQISLDLIRTKFLEYSEKMKEKEIIQGAEEESSY